MLLIIQTLSIEYIDISFLILVTLANQIII